MYNFITSEIKKRIVGNEDKYISLRVLDYNYLLLLYLKYLCDKNNIEDYNECDKLKKIIPAEKSELYGNFFKNKLNELIIHFKNTDLIEVIDDFGKKIDYNILNYIDHIFVDDISKTAYLFISDDYEKQILLNRTHMSSRINFEMYKLIDEIRGVKRQLNNNIKDLDLKNIENIVIIDTQPAYLYLPNSNKNFDIIINFLFETEQFKGKVILKTLYPKISILKNRTLIENYLSKVVLYENIKIKEAVLIFYSERKEEKVSILMINEQIKDDKDKIKELLDNNIFNKENLIKVERDMIINNNYRIGFKMYSSNKTEEVKSINDIIDQNTQIISEITRLNKKIQEQMDELISK